MYHKLKKINGIEIVEIQLTQRLTAICDVEDLHIVIPHKWHPVFTKNTYYATAVLPTRERVYLHKLIKPAPPGFVTNHIDFSGWNDRRDNLEVITKGDDVRHSQSRYLPPSGHKYIYWNKRDERYEVKVQIDKKMYGGGSSRDLETAIKRRDNLLKELANV